jgi:hypothetical protein
MDERGETSGVALFIYLECLSASRQLETLESAKSGGDGLVASRSIDLAQGHRSHCANSVKGDMEP